MPLQRVTWPYLKINRNTQDIDSNCKKTHVLVFLSPGLGPSKISFITIHGSSNIGITVGLYTVSPVQEEGNKFYPGDKQLFKVYYLVST
jgi:hypothetical protein